MSEIEKNLTLLMQTLSNNTYTNLFSIEKCCHMLLFRYDLRLVEAGKSLI